MPFNQSRNRKNCLNSLIHRI